MESAVEANRDQLERSAPFDLRRLPGIRPWRQPSRARHEPAGQADSGHAPHGAVTPAQAQSDDIESDEVTEVLLYAALFLGFVLVVAVGAAVVLGLRALRPW